MRMSLKRQAHDSKLKRKKSDRRDIPQPLTTPPEDIDTSRSGNDSILDVATPFEEIENSRVEGQPECAEWYELTPSTGEESRVIVHSSPGGGCAPRLGHSRRPVVLPSTPASPTLSLVLEWLESGCGVSASDENEPTSRAWNRPNDTEIDHPSPGWSINTPCFETINDKLLSHFCNDLMAVPWTRPATELNSLRSILPLIGAFVPLRNAVMALSAAHYPMELSTCLTYKSQALSTFSAAIQDATDYRTLEHLLATSLVLFNLHSVESAYGQWRVHLRGACQLLMARFRGRDVDLVLRQRPLLHSIVLQISWYDTACAMLSLQPCEIPDHFVRPAILLSMEKATDGGMADTVGCPESIYLVMRGIINGDITSADEILSRTPSDLSTLIGKGVSASHATNRYYCEQAWKYGLVVYLLTTRRQHIEKVQLLSFCTELVKTYTGNLAASSFQKQLLLAIVITGAQVDDLEVREWFRAYCKRHQSEVKFAAYEDGLHIMAETWVLRDEQRAKGLVPTSCWADVTPCHQENQYMLG